jgi:hypothetical protein
MLTIFVVQVVVAILGTSSIGIADWLYNGGRLRQPLHSLWVGGTNAMICLPLVAWTTNIFIGFGILSLTLVGIIEAMIFVWVYRSLSKLAPAQHREDAQSAQHSSPAHIHPNPLIAQQLHQRNQHDGPTEQ